MQKRDASNECYSLKLNGIFGECQEISMNSIKQTNQSKKEKKHKRKNGEVLFLYLNTEWARVKTVLCFCVWGKSLRQRIFL